MSHHYRMLYQINDAPPEGLSRDQIPDGFGACDAMLLASIIYPEDGSLSVLFVSKDGRSGDDLEDKEWFKVWALLSARLAKSETLGEGKRSLCKSVHLAIAEAIMGGRQNAKG